MQESGGIPETGGSRQEICSSCAGSWALARHLWRSPQREVLKLHLSKPAPRVLSDFSKKRSFKYIKIREKLFQISNHSCFLQPEGLNVSRPEALCAPSLAIRPWTCHHHHTCSAAARRVEGCARCELFPAPPRLHFSYTSSHGLSRRCAWLCTCDTSGIQRHYVDVGARLVAQMVRFEPETTAKQAPKLSESAIAVPFPNCPGASSPSQHQLIGARLHGPKQTVIVVGGFQPGVLHGPTNLE